EARLRQFLQQQAGVEKILRLITLQLGTSLMVAVKARMAAESAAELIDAINRAEAATRAEFPEIQWLFFEPDVTDLVLLLRRRSWGRTLRRGCGSGVGSLPRVACRHDHARQDRDLVHHLHALHV